MQKNVRLVRITRKQNSRIGTKEFTCQFWEPGLVSYEDAGLGKALLRKETMDKIAPDFVGKPVLIEHQDGSPEQLFKNGSAVGKIKDVRWNAETGWYDCDFTVENEEAADKIEKEGWSVSCAFDSLDNGSGGVHHAIDYQFEIMGGNAIHLALVPNPRYEDSKIFQNSGLMLINSKKAHSMKENSNLAEEVMEHIQATKLTESSVVSYALEKGYTRAQGQQAWIEIHREMRQMNGKENDHLGENTIRVTFTSKLGKDIVEEFSSESNAKLRGMALGWQIKSIEKLKPKSNEVPSPELDETVAKEKKEKIADDETVPKQNSKTSNRRVKINLSTKKSKETNAMLGLFKFFGKKENAADKAKEGLVDHKNSYVMIESQKVAIDELLNAQEETEKEMKANDEGTEELPIENESEEIEVDGKKHKIGDLIGNYKKREAAKKANAETPEEKAKKEKENADKEKEMTIQKENAKKEAELKNAPVPKRDIRYFRSLNEKHEKANETIVNAGNAFETMADKVARGKNKYGKK